MKKYSFILFFFSLMLSTTSCLTLMTSEEPSGSNISSDYSYGNNRYLYLKIFQTLNENEALAVTRKNDIVKIESYEDVYYDGNIVSGKFAFIGTYTYKTVSRAGDTEEFREKTVPVFMKTTEYKKIYNYKNKNKKIKQAYDLF